MQLPDEACGSETPTRAVDADIVADQVALGACFVGKPVEQAAAAARGAFEKRWSTLAPAQRGAYLFKLADLISENLEELGHLEAFDTGKPVKKATGEIWFAAETYRYYAGWATKLSGRSFDPSLQADPYHCFTLRQPVGVVAGIIAWNFPFVLASWKVAPALAAGCTIILKPAEETPLTALRLAELCDEAGLPPGVLNILTGLGETAGAALAQSNNVDKVCFTGSVDVGKKNRPGGNWKFKTSNPRTRRQITQYHFCRHRPRIGDFSSSDSNFS